MLHRGYRVEGDPDAEVRFHRPDDGTYLGSTQPEDGVDPGSVIADNGKALSQEPGREAAFPSSPGQSARPASASRGWRWSRITV